jgi:ribonuclease PH
MPARIDGRSADQLRPLTIEANVAPHASGSVLLGFGATRVICAATIEAKVPSWMKQQGVKGGWLTAEYSMLPYSTLDRKPRDITKGKIDGRTVEIQRLIGRSLRAVLDLEKLGEHTLWIDCDVLQADGGTRTASITGAYIAARLAIQRLLDAKKITENPLTDSVAARPELHRGQGRRGGRQRRHDRPRPVRRGAEQRRGIHLLPRPAPAASRPGAEGPRGTRRSPSGLPREAAALSKARMAAGLH